MMTIKQSIYFIFLCLWFLFAGKPLSAESLEDFGLLSDPVDWKGYTFKQVSDDGEFWYGLFVKEEDTLAVFDQGYDERMTRSAFVPVPGQGDSMLVIEQFSGGAHCCWTYTLLNADQDSHRIVFTSSEYPVGYPVSLEDLNRNGKTEWIQHLLTFDYFLVLSHAQSPIIPVVFSYDTENGTYIPANPDFKALLLQNINRSEQFLRNSPPIHTPVQPQSPNLEVFSHLLKVVLTLYYAGEYTNATALFQKYYTASDAQIVLDQIVQKLENCLVFQEIYTRYPPENPEVPFTD